MADLGDLSNFLREGSIADLDWLDVSEKDYKELESLPRQNLDVVPDLEAIWSHEDKAASALVPNKDLIPSSNSALAENSESLVRVARLTIMQTTEPAKIQNALMSRFAAESIRGARTALAEVFAERGLLGRFYIDASDFPDCASGSKKAAEFVRRFASEAPFVKAKDACGQCVHRQVSANGSSHCAVFHKQIEVDVPYTEALAQRVEQLQQSKGKDVQASATDPKERIRLALLASDRNTAQGFSGVPQQAPKPVQGNTQEQLISLSNLTRKRDEAAQAKLAAEKARPIVTLLRREMLKGRSESELIQAMKLAFDARDLKATRSQWEPVFREAGLYGSIYSTQDSFEDCREGADFLSKHGSKVRAIVAGDKCGSCIFAKAGRCMMYGRKLVASLDDVLTSETVKAVIDEHKMAGTLPYTAASMEWGETPAEALQAVYKAASGPRPTTAQAFQGTVAKGFYGGSQAHGTSELVRRDIVKTASRYLNEGLYGADLLAVLKSRFDPRDLVASAEDLKVVLAEQGLQGIKYVDPTVYEDYGRGCHEASRLHRSRAAVKYVTAGDKCGSCVHQTRPGYCSVLNKQLVVEPPYVDKVAEQRAVLNSGSSMTVGYADLVNNGMTMMQEMELVHQASDIELNPESPKIDLDIEFGPQDVKL